MKKFILATAFVLASFGVSTPAKANYGWQCSYQQYCGYNAYGYYGCWQRQQCCEWVWNPWNGAYAWQCTWR